MGRITLLKDGQITRVKEALLQVEPGLFSFHAQELLPDELLS